MVSSSSSSSFSSCKYDVFLSFRGEDTRDNFTSHLVSALRRKKLETFIDEELQRGDEISPALLNAIERSKISVIVFSKNYASSKWCLDELVKILECQKMNGQIVIPVFYHVDPSDVRKQTRIFGNAFLELAKRFKRMPEKVQKWRAVLTEASNLSGWDSVKIRPEAELVEEIVKDVLKKLEHRSVSNDFEGFVGLRARIEQLKSLLCVGLTDFRIVGIWGMGGIGKTTIAGAIFNQISNEFECKSFMANVREESERDGLAHLRERFFSEIFEEDIKIGTPNLPASIKERLQQMKVFIVLDDVNKSEQLDYLAGGLDQLGPGSRIIITSRDKQVLVKCGVGYIYEVERLNYHEANRLFCNYAFRQNHCTQDLQVLLDGVTNYASGNPLALKVLGSSFRQNGKQEWKNALNKLNWISDPAIYNVLRISYDELTWEEKNIFLDIACFFKGYDKNQVTTILDDQYSVHYGLDVLVDKSLITILDNKLQMHDLLQEMGREIVREECKKNPGKRSRLWDHDDIYHLLQKQKGTDAIEGIFLDLSKIRDIHIGSRAFAKMSNLRLLKFYMPEYFHVSDISFKVHLPEGLEYLSDELTYLHWHGFPLRTLPVNFSPENLIELSLPCGKIHQLWEGKKEAFKLKSINLQHCQYLIRTPEPSEIPNLEKINLLNCTNLSDLPLYIRNFDNLGLLCLKGCKNFRCFPRNIHFRSPITIDFAYCDNLAEFPQISGNIIDLNLWGTAIEEVPSTIESLTSLVKLNMSDCKRLMHVSTSICKLKSLRRLYLAFCSKFESFPEILERMEHLEYIDLVSTKIKELPSSIEHLEGLTELRLSDCSELYTLPENLRNLKSLKLIQGENSAIRQLPYSITDLDKLEKLSFSGCKGLVLPPLPGFSNLTELYLNDCDIIEIPHNIGCLSSLERLYLRGNNFESLPTSIKQLSCLRSLHLSDCNMLQSLPELPLCLEFFEAKNCKQLQSLPEIPPYLEELDTFMLETPCQYSNDEFLRANVEFRFNDCLKLKETAHNNVLADSQLRIQHMAIKSLKLFHFYENEFAEPPGINICLPGSAIPDWFCNRCSGSSVTIQLPQHCYNRNLIGFALCAVVATGNGEVNKFLNVKCCCCFEIKTLYRSTEHYNITFPLSDGIYIDSDHVFLGFDPFWNFRLPDGYHHTTVSFHFSLYNVRSQEIKKGYRVKCCGVSPIYAHPNETQPNNFTVNMLPPTEEEFTQIRKLHNKFCHDNAVTSGKRPCILRSDEEEVEQIYSEHINAIEQKSSFFPQTSRNKVGFLAFLIFAFLLFNLTPLPLWELIFDW